MRGFAIILLVAVSAMSLQSCAVVHGIGHESRGCGECGYVRRVQLAGLPNGVGDVGNLILRSYRFKQDVMNQGDSICNLLDFSDSISVVEYSGHGDSLIKSVNILGTNNTDESDFMWRTTPDGGIEYGHLHYKMNLCGDAAVAVPALSRFVSGHPEYDFFTVPHIIGVWGIKGKQIIHLSLFRCKSRKDMMVLSSKKHIDVTEPILLPIDGPFNSWLRQKILCDADRKILIGNGAYCIAGGKTYCRWGDIIIVIQDGQSLFRVILNKVGYDGIANLMLGSDPMMIVGK